MSKAQSWWRRFRRWWRGEAEPEPTRRVGASADSSPPRAAPQVKRSIAISKVPPGVRPAPGAPLDLHLGIDFGTRFTKVCVRDIGRERSWLVGFSRNAHANLSEALIPSVVHVVDGKVALGSRDGGPGAGSSARSGVRLEFLKLLLAQLDGEAAVGALRCPDGFDARAIEALATFYLAHVIQKARRWVHQQRAEFLVGREAHWSVSVGVPVQFSDSPAKPRFQRVLQMAMAWADMGVDPEVSMADLRLTAGRLQERPSKAPCDVVSEITAAIRSFVATPGAPEGVYLYVDVGAGTVEGVSFRFDRAEGRPRLDLYCGRVEPLGVSAVALRLTQETGLPLHDVEASIMSAHVDEILEGRLGPSEKDLRQLIAGVVLPAKRVEPARWSAGLEQLAAEFRRRQRFRDSRSVPLFIGGGGALSPFYRRTVESTYYANRLDMANVRRYVLADIPQPEDLDMAGISPEHFHRFAIAYGLSVPVWELPTELLPTRKSAGQRPRSQHPPGVVRYEDTKDAFC